MTPPRPYAGLTVVEAVFGEPGSAVPLAAAMTGRIFADLGARVIRVCAAAQQSPLDRFLSARKTTVAGNVGDRGFLTKMLHGADVAIIDQPVQLAVGAEELPKCVALLALVGGRHADTPIRATEFTISAMGGLLHMVGDPDREPLKLGGHQEAYALGLSAFCGLAALLASRTRSGRQVIVRANLLDTIIWLNWKSVPLQAGAAIPPGRAGAAAEWLVLRCADGWVALVYQEPDWPHLRDMAGDGRLLDARFATRQGRRQHAVELAAIIEAAFLSRTRRQIHEEASACRLPLGPVWSPPEVISDPHNVFRALFEELPPLAGEDRPIRAPRLPVLWNGASVSSPAEAAPTQLEALLP